MTILGSIVEIESKSATIVLICVIALLVWLDTAIAKIESVAHHNGYHGIFHKVNKEMMILGLVSFSTFIAFEGLGLSPDGIWYLAFEFAHILVLFIALSFVMQALALTLFISNQRKRLYRLFYLSEELLLSKYEILRQYKLHKTVPRLMQLIYNVFHYAPLTFPIPALRDAMEYKILEEHFIRSFLLPEQFHFAEYMSRRFKAYIFALVEVHPTNWFVLVVLVGLNYGRVTFIDPIYQDGVCSQFEHDDQSSHRMLAAAGGGAVHTSPGCDQYSLRVTFFYAMMLSLYVAIVFYYSDLYMQRHLNHAVRALLEPPQCRCEQHIPFQPQFDDYDEYLSTGHYRSLYRICMMNIVAVRRREKEITAMRSIMRLRADEEKLRREEEENDRELMREEAAANGEGDPEAAAAVPEMPERRRGSLAGAGARSPAQTRPAPESAWGGRAREVDSDDDDYIEVIGDDNDDSSDSSDGSDVDERYMDGMEAAGSTLGNTYLTRSTARNYRGGSLVPPGSESARRMPERLDTIHQPRDSADSSSSGKAAKPRGSMRNRASFTLPTSGTTTRHRSGSFNKRATSISRLKGQEGADSGGRSRGRSSSGDAIGARGRSDIGHHGWADPVLNNLVGSSTRGHNLRTFYAEVSKRLSSSQHGRTGSGGGHVEGSGVGSSDDYRRVPSAPPLGSSRLDSELVGGATTESAPATGVEFKLEQDTSHLFLWRSQWIYRLTLELALLLQCFYIAIWCTQIFVVTINTEYYPGLWFVALTLPMIFNFLLLSKVLFLSCTLEAVSMLNLKDAGAVTEKAILSEEATEKFRSIFRSRLLEMTHIPRNDRRHYVREKLRELKYIDEDPDEDDNADASTGSAAAATAAARTTGYHITYAEFRKFLFEFHIFMSERSFLTLCHAMDKQKWVAGHHSHDHHNVQNADEEKGSISVLYIYYVLFPEAAFRQQRRQSVLAATNSVRTKREISAAAGLGDGASDEVDATSYDVEAAAGDMAAAQHEFHLAQAGDIRIHNKGSLNSEYLMFKKKPSESRVMGAIASAGDKSGETAAAQPPSPPSWRNMYGLMGGGLRSISLDMEQGAEAGAGRSQARDTPTGGAGSGGHRQPVWKKLFNHRRGSGRFGTGLRRTGSRLMDEVELVVDGSAFGASSTITGISPEEAAEAEAEAAEAELRASFPEVAQGASAKRRDSGKAGTSSTIDALAVTTMVAEKRPASVAVGGAPAGGSAKLDSPSSRK